MESVIIQNLTYTNTSNQENTLTPLFTSPIESFYKGEDDATHESQDDTKFDATSESSWEEQSDLPSSKSLPTPIEVHGEGTRTEISKPYLISIRITGNNNVVTVAKGTNVNSIIIEGANNVVYLPRGTETDIINIGEDCKVYYY